MTRDDRLILLATIIAWATALILISTIPAWGQERGRIYDNAGQYRGRIEQDYSGRRDRVLDEQGRRMGAIDRGRPPEPRSLGPSPDIRGNFWREPRR